MVATLSVMGVHEMDHDLIIKRSWTENSHLSAIWASIRVIIGGHASGKWTCLALELRHLRSRLKSSGHHAQVTANSPKLKSCSNQSQLRPWKHQKTRKTWLSATILTRMNTITKRQNLSASIGKLPPYTSTGWQLKSLRNSWSKSSRIPTRESSHCQILSSISSFCRTLRPRKSSHKTRNKSGGHLMSNQLRH